MLPRETLSAVIWLCLTIVVAPLYFFAFSAYRVGTSSSPVALMPMPMPVLANNTLARESACLLACNGGTCRQGDSGIVLQCLSCPTNQSPIGARCFSASCTNVPWCSSMEASTLIQLNANLNIANMSSPLQSSRVWTSILAFADAATATALIRELTKANAELRLIKSNALASSWYDDQRGWWGSSLSSYNGDLPVPLATFTSHMKRLVCARTWRLQASNCVPP
jgi:hypothetical protein